MSRGSARLRAAAVADADFLLALRNDPEVRAQSRSSAIVERAEHGAWLRSLLDDPARHLYVIEDEEGTAVGQVRLDCNGEHAEVSIALVGSARGRGFASSALAATEAEAHALRLTSLTAVVKETNHDSLQLFTRAGFFTIDRVDDLVELRRPLR